MHIEKNLKYLWNKQNYNIPSYSPDQLEDYFYSLLDWPITGEHLRSNPQTVDKCKHKHL